MNQPIKNRVAFFDYLEEGLQAYFDNHDRFFGGVIHLTVGVREGLVGGIIKSEEALHYSGFTLDRVKNILTYVLPRHLERTAVAQAVDDIIDELRMGSYEPKPIKNCKHSKTKTKKINKA